MLNKDEIERYCRQIILPNFGVSGQENLKSSSAIIVGAGGLGCPVSLYVAAAGVGRIGLVDHDTVEISNLHRQIAHSEDRRGMLKVDSLAKTLQSLNSSIRIELYPEQITSQNALNILEKYDLVIDATDNVITRYLLNDSCVLLGKPLVSGAALGLDGQLTTYNFGGGPCYRCILPVPPPPESVTSCDMGGVLGPIVGTIGSLQALEVIRILALKQSNYSGKMLLFSGQAGTFRTINLRPKRSICELCGENPKIKCLVDYQLFCGSREAVRLLEPSERLSVDQLKMTLDDNAKSHHILIDVRNKIHSDIFTFPGALKIPLSELSHNIQIVREKLSENPHSQVICICRRGNDSQKAVVLLRQHGITSKDVEGGIHKYANLIDNKIPIT